MVFRGCGSLGSGPWGSMVLGGGEAYTLLVLRHPVAATAAVSVHPTGCILVSYVNPII